MQSMKDYVIIQGRVFFALFLLAISSFIVWMKTQGIQIVAGPLLRLRRIETQRSSAILFAKQNSPSSIDPQAGDVAQKAPKDRLSSAGDWLVPIIVWFLVLTMGVAIVGFLLGEK